MTARRSRQPGVGHYRAQVDALFPNASTANEAADELRRATLAATSPVWGGSPGRPWLLQITCPPDLSDGVDPVRAARAVIDRTVRLHGGLVIDDVPEHTVVPGVNYSLRPGGAPFMGRLSQRIVTEYERAQSNGASSANDDPLPGMPLLDDLTS